MSACVFVCMCKEDDDISCCAVVNHKGIVHFFSKWACVRFMVSVQPTADQGSAGLCSVNSFQVLKLFLIFKLLSVSDSRVSVSVVHF